MFKNNLSIEELRIKKRCLRAIEAILFSLGEPIELSRLFAILSPEFPLTSSAIASLLDELALSYEEEKRGFRLQRTKEGYLLTSSIEFASFIEQLKKPKRMDKLSPQSLEVLAIIAFKGPISRTAIDQLRGVDSSHILHTLQERGCIEKEEGKVSERKGPLWKVTSHFLTHLGISDPASLLSTTTST